MYKKRLTALLLAVCMLCSLCVTARAADDTTALETIRTLGIMKGDEDGNLNLSANVTRAEFVTMMVSASAYKDSIGSGSGVSLFQDVKSSHWASEYIKLALEQGWVSGYVDVTFRPNNQITLEEACTALLKMLGYDSASLAGSFPSAQLSKASAIGLLDDLNLSQGDVLTRNDCVRLFYNLLVCENSEGTVYGTTLGYTVKNGEIDYATLVSANTKGPYVAESSSLSLPFSTGNVTVYRNGSAADLSDVQQYDVYYYNENLRTVWVYSDRVTGTLTEISPSRAAPTSVTVAGLTYELETSTATYKVSSQGSFTTGDLVTLLLGMDGTVVDVIDAQESESTYYGMVLSSEKSASSSSTTSSSTSSVQIVTEVVCTDGSVRTFYHTGSVQSEGRLVSVSITQSGTTIKGLSTAKLEGPVNSSATNFAGYDFAEDVEILDTDSNGGYARIYPSRLAGAKLSGSDVAFYTLNDNDEIDRLILEDVTGDTAEYVYITNIEDNSTDMNLSAVYSYYQDGQITNYNSDAIFSISTGGAALYYDEDGSIRSMRQLSSVTLTELGSLSAMAGSQEYTLDENVQVILRSSGSSGYYETTLSSINAEDYTLKGWYDNLGYSAGGRIRIIVATEK